MPGGFAGDHVVVTYPGYQSLFENARALGCKLSHWKPVWGPRGWKFELAHLQQLLEPRTKVGLAELRTCAGTSGHVGCVAVHGKGGGGYWGGDCV